MNKYPDIEYIMHRNGKHINRLDVIWDFHSVVHYTQTQKKNLLRNNKLRTKLATYIFNLSP